MIRTKEELDRLPEVKKSVVELLYALADDDVVTAYRGSEWLGLCPYIEEDVAYSSISQNTMGHGVMYYLLLEELGEGTADELAHLRQATQWRNAILLEEVNGKGTYLKDPDFDWAFAIVRNFFYETAKQLRLQSLTNSSYEPLKQVAVRVKQEQFYHLKHWEVWFRQLVSSTPSARQRMLAQVERAWQDVGGLFSLGPTARILVQHGIIEEERLLKEAWLEKMNETFKELQIKLPEESVGMSRGDGRNGQHTDDLQQAIETLSEVYKTDVQATW